MRGRAVPELRDTSIRERFVYSYRLLYRVQQDRVIVLSCCRSCMVIACSCRQPKALTRVPDYRSSGDSTPRPPRLSTWVYICVVLTSLCPSSSWIVRMS